MLGSSAIPNICGSCMMSDSSRFCEAMKTLAFEEVVNLDTWAASSSFQAQ